VPQLRDIGEKCLGAGETAEALRYLTEAAQKKPGDAAIEYDLGLAYNQRGLQDKALLHLQDALKLKPDNPEAYNALGKVYAERGQFEAARAAFQKALDDPFYKTPQLAANNLGMLYEKNGESERALTYYEQAVKLDRNYGAAWFRIGEIQEKLNRNDDARHAYGNAVRLIPDLAEAHLHFGILSFTDGDIEAAVYSLTRVGELAPNTDMADEARKWLQKIDSSPSAKKLYLKRHSSSRPLPGEVDFIAPKAEEPEERAVSGQNPSQGSTGASPGGTATIISSPEGVYGAPSPPPAGDVSGGPESRAPGGVSTAPATQAPEPTGVPPESAAPPAPGRLPGIEAAQDGSQPSYRYMVQIGAFLDKGKAEEVRSRLQAKGYKAAVKAVKDRALGMIFVIRLQPVNSLSNATTLVTQLSGEIEGEPLIIKVPK
jgi:tetratricopeptide (TPR) repeat protein